MCSCRWTWGGLSKCGCSVFFRAPTQHLLILADHTVQLPLFSFYPGVPGGHGLFAFMPSMMSGSDQCAVCIYQMNRWHSLCLGFSLCILLQLFSKDKTIVFFFATDCGECWQGILFSVPVLNTLSSPSGRWSRRPMYLGWAITLFCAHSCQEANLYFMCLGSQERSSLCSRQWLSFLPS